MAPTGPSRDSRIQGPAANSRFSLTPTLSRWEREFRTGLRGEKGFCEGLRWEWGFCEGLLRDRTFFGVTGRFETFPYGAVMRNLRFSGELGIQGAAANWRFTLTPTLSLREREF